MEYSQMVHGVSNLEIGDITHQGEDDNPTTYVRDISFQFGSKSVQITLFADKKEDLEIVIKKETRM